MRVTFLDKLLLFILRIFAKKVDISDKEADFVQANLTKNYFEKTSLEVFKMCL